MTLRFNWISWKREIPYIDRFTDVFRIIAYRNFHEHTWSDKYFMPPKSIMKLPFGLYLKIYRGQCVTCGKQTVRITINRKKY